MQKWQWIDKQLLMMLHDESLLLHSGASGIRLALYSEPDFADLAAAYTIGLAKNHAFVDGNKRVAFLAVGLFLSLNGYNLTATQKDATQTMLAVASGEMQETHFAQ
jgi:death on curing protein